MVRRLFGALVYAVSTLIAGLGSYWFFERTPLA